MKRLLLSGAAAMVKRLVQASRLFRTPYLLEEDEAAQNLIHYFLAAGIIANLKSYSNRKYARGAIRLEDSFHFSRESLV